MKPTIKVSQEVHKKIVFFNTNNCNNYIKCFMIGQNHKQIIDTMIPLRGGYDGCEWMPDLSTGSMTNGMIQLAKINKKPIGIARIGRFDRANDTRRGYVLSELVRMDENAIMISYNENEFLVEGMKKCLNKKTGKINRRKKYYTYAVV